MYQVTTRQVSPFQVEFPTTKKEGKKSVEFEKTTDGARYFRPGALAYLSADEYRFLKADGNLRLKFVFQGEVKERKKAEPIKPVLPASTQTKAQGLKKAKNKKS